MDTGVERRGRQAEPGSGPDDAPPPVDGGSSGRARILFVSKTAESTGPTTSLTLLLDRLSRTHDVVVLVQGEGRFCEVLQDKGIPHWSYPSLERSALPAIFRLLRRERFSLIYANETSRASRNVCVAGKVLGIPFVSHVRSMGWRHGWPRLGHLRAAEAVVAVSHACGESVARFVRRGRLHVVHNGVPETALFTASEERRAQTRRELGIGDGTRLIVSVSHLSPRKGQIHAVEAVGWVLERAGQVHLALVGARDRDPEYVDRLMQAAEAPNVSGRVSVLGFRPDVPRLLEGADILLHTALADPHPRAVIEGMAAGLPVVAFATDGVTETVADGQTGYLVAPKDAAALGTALLRLIKDPDLCETFGKAARRRVREAFLEGHTADRVADVVGSVMATKKVLT
jgi:glycosyltransferase involved in cell wall biosynthesis